MLEVELYPNVPVKARFVPRKLSTRNMPNNSQITHRDEAGEITLHYITHYITYSSSDTAVRVTFQFVTVRCFAILVAQLLDLKRGWRDAIVGRIYER